MKANERGQASSDTNHVVHVCGGVHVVALDSSDVAEISMQPICQRLRRPIPQRGCPKFSNTADFKIQQVDA